MADYAGENLDTLLGQEFLTWLWYRSESSSGQFRLGKDNAPFALYMEQRVVVRGGEGENRETASVSGSMSPLREARLGLSTGKLVVRALVRLEKDGQDWQTSLNADNFAIAGLKTPPIAKPEEGDDPDAAFLEKVYLMEQGLEMLDDVYLQFLQVRLDQAAWNREVKNVADWITRDLARGAQLAE